MSMHLSARFALDISPEAAAIFTNTKYGQPSSRISDDTLLGFLQAFAGCANHYNICSFAPITDDDVQEALTAYHAACEKKGGNVGANVSVSLPPSSLQIMKSTHDRGLKGEDAKPFHIMALTQSTITLDVDNLPKIFAKALTGFNQMTMMDRLALAMRISEDLKSADGDHPLGRMLGATLEIQKAIEVEKAKLAA